MSFSEIQRFLVKKTQILQTEAWKQNTTKSLAQLELSDQYTAFLSQQKGNFVDYLAANIQNVVAAIKTVRQEAYSAVIKTQVLVYMQQEKALFVEKAQKVLLQPVSLAEKINGKGELDVARSSRLAGVDPASSFNTLDIQSKLDRLDNFDSLFGQKIAVEKTNEEKAQDNVRLTDAAPKLLMLE